MNYKYAPKKKYLIAAINSIVLLLGLILLLISSLMHVDLKLSGYITFSLLFGVLIIRGIYQTFYSFTLHKRDYLIVNEQALSVYRGNFIPRKTILFKDIVGVFQHKEMIMLKLENGKEEQIYLDWLTQEDAMGFKQDMKERLPSKVQGFKDV